MILTAVEIAHPSFSPQTYQVYLLMVALLIVEGLVTTCSTKVIARVNVVGTIVNTLVVFIFAIWLPLGSINEPKTNPNNIVWTSDGFENGTEWPIGFSFLMGLLSPIVVISGFE